MSETAEQNRWRKVWDVPSQTKSTAERHLAVLALGIMQALRQRRMSATGAWENGLNFKTYLDLKKLHADRRLLELWQWAMELPQVEKLGDEALAESIEAIEKLASAVLADRNEAAEGARGGKISRKRGSTARKRSGTGSRQSGVGAGPVH